MGSPRHYTPRVFTYIGVRKSSRRLDSGNKMKSSARWNVSAETALVKDKKEQGIARKKG